MIIRIIGDVHGKYKHYKKIIKESPYPTIQVGDMGVGFMNSNTGKMMTNPPHKTMVDNNARFIRGNHDNPFVCKKHSQFINDGHVENNIMFVGGADSIDKEWRTEGFDWWKDEQVSREDFIEIINKFEKQKPKIMITHDCPWSLYTQIHKHVYKVRNDTANAFDIMFSVYKPKLWIFGHHHKSFDKNILGTRFICLNELEFIDLDIEKTQII